MADGRLVHQPKDANRSVVFGATVYEAPLLPYEKQLIATLGCSEEEYRWFVAEAIKRGRQRPAGYEHIPDVQCAPAVPILVNIAIGLVLTGISYLLTPKPRAPKGAKDPRTQQQLDSIRGGNRFVPSYGFDTAAELADYGSAIPIIFGLYNDVEKAGGVLVSPRLVWSRMSSHGNQQSAKLMFVVGEQGKADAIQPDGIAAPNITGIFIGNNALDAVFARSFAFYWKRNTTSSGFSRIRNFNLLYGSGGTRDSADYNNGLSASEDDVYLCPTRLGELQPGFSYAYTPANNTEFGVYGPIANGNGYRLNWRVISIPGKSDPEGRLDAERTKIAGTSAMSGIGRNYSRRMGIVAYSGSGSQVFSNDLRQEYEINENDEITFLISNTKIPSNYLDGKVTIEDINSEIESQQIAADDAMQVGELFSIGATIWQVTSRSIDQFVAGDGQDQEIRLKCIDVKDAKFKRIGVVSRSEVINPSKDYIGNDTDTVGAAFYVLTKYARGTVRNNRPCDVTEIGIVSNVYQQLNGICNFQNLPTPDELKEYDKNAVSLASGTITSYIARSSVFSIYVRKAGLDDNGSEFEYAPLGLNFVVTGTRPVAQYNSIRLYHPDAPSEYEYKFVPRAAAELRNMAETDILIQLDSGSTETVGTNVQVGAYGTFKVLASGREKLIADIRRNKEFFNQIEAGQTTRQNSYPSTIGVRTLLPDTQPDETTFLTAVERVELVSDPSNASIGRTGAFTWAAFGDPDEYPIGEGERTNFRRRENISGGRWVELEYEAVKLRLPEGHYARDTGQEFLWSVDQIRVVTSSSGWDSLSTFVVRRGENSTGDGTSQAPFDSSNPWAVNRSEAGDLRSSGLLLRVTGVESTVQVQGRSQGYRQEIFGYAGRLQNGKKKEAIRPLTTASGKSITIKLESYVYEESGHWTDETKFWSSPVITVLQDGTDNGGWSEGDVFDDLVTVSDDNVFAEAYREKGQQIGSRYSVQAISTNIIVQRQDAYERGFEQQSQYAELSFYTGLVNKSCDSEPEHRIVYVNEIVNNETEPQYHKLTTAGLVLRSSRSFTRLDQLRVWLERGIQVRRLHPNTDTYNDSVIVDTPAEGPSNLFTDLVFYLLTNATAGAGKILNMNAYNANLIDVDSFISTSKFLRSNKLFCNGAITDKINLRDFISANAPNFLCNFVVKNGKFGLVPVVPTTAEGEISRNPVQIKQIFTAGNILEDSFELEYLEAEERRMFAASIRFRQERRNKLPEERTITVRFKEDGQQFVPIENFDLTQFCTTEHHAEMAGRYFLAIRKLVTHTIRFATTFSGLDLAPGDFIKVVTEAAPYSSAKNGTVDASGTITSVSDIPDGTYNVTYYKVGSDDIESGQMQVTNETVSDSTFFNSVFTIIESTNSQNIYLVEQLTINEDMTVQIVASEYPCDDNQISELAKLLTDDAVYTSSVFF